MYKLSHQTPSLSDAAQPHVLSMVKSWSGLLFLCLVDQANPRLKVCTAGCINKIRKQHEGNNQYDFLSVNSRLCAMKTNTKINTYWKVINVIAIAINHY